MNALFPVRTNAVPGRDAGFDRCYDEVHLPEVLALDGFGSARRYRLAEPRLQPDRARGWLALYEIDDDVDTVPGDVCAATHLRQTDALDAASSAVSVFLALGPRRVSA